MFKYFYSLFVRHTILSVEKYSKLNKSSNTASTSLMSINSEEETKKRRAANRNLSKRHANMHMSIIKATTEPKLKELHQVAKAKIDNNLKMAELRENEENIAKAQEAIKNEEETERKKYIEAHRWKPKTESDKFADQLIHEWITDFEMEKEKFFHASFVLTWFIHRKFGVCFTGGIERWGKDRDKLKPFGGRRESIDTDVNIKETREETASRELREETIGLVNIQPNDLGKLPHVFILKTNPCFLYNVEVNHYDFRERLRNEKNPSSLEMKAVVHIPFQQFYNLKLDQIPGKGIRVEDISGRTTDISAFYLHALRGFGFI